MALHFERSEFDARRDRLIIEMAEKKLDAVLLFAQESMYWLTGYDTFGYVFFQCLYLGADGTLTLLTRAPDLRSARWTSMIEDLRIWEDRPDARPAEALRELLEGHGCRAKRLGIEWDAYGLTAANGRRVSAALEGFCELVDASERRHGQDPGRLEQQHAHHDERGTSGSLSHSPTLDGARPVNGPLGRLSADIRSFVDDRLARND